LKLENAWAAWREISAMGPSLPVGVQDMKSFDLDSLTKPILMTKSDGCQIEALEAGHQPFQQLHT